VKADRWIRRAAAAAVVAVAAFAAVVSYSHIYELGRTHGQSGTAARLLPLSVDGLLLAASLVLLHEGRKEAGAPALARCMLWLGVSATVGANVAYGAPYGALGAIISALPAVSFVGSVEMVMGMVSRARPPVPALLQSAPAGSAEEAAISAYAASVAGGNPFSERALADRFGIPRSAARRIRTGLALAGSNGHGGAA
jgi:hypothetical protein